MLQLGALRDALIDAGASPEKADRAAEELAGYENPVLCRKLTKQNSPIRAPFVIMRRWPNRILSQLSALSATS
jgi:hypothetical protein